MNERLKVDLAALNSEKLVLVLPDKREVEYSPPSLRQFAKLLALQNIENEDDAMEQFNAFIKFEDFLRDVVPELEDFELNFGQATALMEQIQEGVMPGDVKALEDKGIVVSDSQKKVLSDSLTP